MKKQAAMTIWGCSEAEATATDESYDIDAALEVRFSMNPIIVK